MQRPGPLAGMRVRRDGRHRAGAARLPDAVRNGRGRCCASSARPRIAPFSAYLPRIRSRSAGPVDPQAGSKAARKAWRCSPGLIANADVLVEGFRPGVMERMGLGPDVALAANPRPRLWPHDRLRPRRPAGPARRPRPHLSRLFGRAACHRPQGREAGAAAQPRGRLWRRHHVPDCRHAGRAVRRASGQARARWWMRR